MQGNRRDRFGGNTMIKNERQLRITRAQLEKLKSHLNAIEQARNAGNISPLIDIERDAIRNQIVELENQVLGYEQLWSSNKPIPLLDSFEKIPQALIEARISLGLSQKELAERIGVNEQQIQRYEATEYESASFSRIKQLIRALNLDMSAKMQFPNEDITYGDFFRGIKKIGLSDNLIFKRILPSQVVAYLSEVDKNALIDNVGVRTLEYISRIFRLTPVEILNKEPLRMHLTGLGNVRFKVRRKANLPYTTAYTFYAHYLALLILQASQHLPIKPFPKHPYEIRNAIIEKYGSLSLENSIRYVWSLGTPVISLNDPSAFQGAYFRERGRSIILLKLKTKSPARWQFDLFHEVWHALQHQEDDATIITEIEDFEKISPEEIEASLFAGAVLLGRAPDDLVQMCIKEAHHDLVKLKQAVKLVAIRENVQVDILANCVAYRISQEGGNWWGAAENLQEQKNDIQAMMQDVLLEFVDLHQLSDDDLDLLIRTFDNFENLEGNHD